MKHIDLFSGIGGFSLAFDNIFHEQKNTHTFIEIDPFCQEVLKKHWPEATIIGDIRTFTNSTKSNVGRSNARTGERQKPKSRDSNRSDTFLITGGFPCQPFSQAGRRKGTEDDRHLWPEMLRVIRDFKPTWVIAENVRGLLTIGGGVVFEQVCSDLEREDYDVQPVIIPAVSVNAPHRRDRVWFIANRRQQYGSKRRNERMETNKTERASCKPDSERCGENDSNTISERLERGRKEWTGQRGQPHRTGGNQGPDWNKNWYEVATALCRVDDGVPRKLDRNPRLKALGNAIVPQVAEEIIKYIKYATNNTIQQKR